jgi:hypothetical protein
MGFLFNKARNDRPWDNYGLKSKSKSKSKGKKKGNVKLASPGKVMSGPSWKNMEFKGAKEAMAKRESLSLEAAKDRPLELDPDERPTQLSVGRFVSITVLVFVVFLSLLVIIGLQVRHLRLGREVYDLNSKRVGLMEKNRHYRAEMAKITVVGDLEVVARETLGLVTPDKGQIVIIP